MENELKNLVSELCYTFKIDSTMEREEIMSVLMDNLDAEYYNVKDLNGLFRIF